MTRNEMLLTILSEECNEVGQRVSKAIRFGLQEVQEGHQLTNVDRIVYELNDLLAVIHIMQDESILPKSLADTDQILAKQHKIERYLEYSEKCGTLTTHPLNK